MHQTGELLTLAFRSFQLLARALLVVMVVVVASSGDLLCLCRPKKKTCLSHSSLHEWQAFRANQPMETLQINVQQSASSSCCCFLCTTHFGGVACLAPKCFVTPLEVWMGCLSTDQNASRTSAPGLLGAFATSRSPSFSKLPAG